MDLRLLASQPPVDPTEGLPPDARAIVREEEELLARVQAALRERAPSRRRDEGDLLERLKELRELASKAAAHDLPTLFQEMNVVRSLLEQPQEEAAVDARSPYFAHLRLSEPTGERDFCLGRASFVSTAREVRVVDWRFAPIARLYYRYREGDPFEEQLPGRLAEGTVSVRRVVVIHAGQLTRIVAGSRVLVRRREDGRWLEEGAGLGLGGGAGTAARAGSLGVGQGITDRSRQADVSALLDREQYDALSAAGDKPLLVLGSAGSGKTTVALHRLATLAFREPQRYPVPRIQVVVPESGLARLSSRLLEPLGLGAVSVKTLEAWFRERVHGSFGTPVRLCPETPPLIARLKRHPSLYHSLRQRLLRQGTAGPTSYGPVRRELAELFTDRTFLAAVVEGARGGLPTTCIDETVRHTMFQIQARPERETRGFDPGSLETVDGLELSEGTPEELAGTLDVEDLPIFLFLKAWRSALGGSRLAHLVVDEAEDISLFELFVLGKLLGDQGERSVTLAGDDAQQTFTSFAGWDQALSALGAQNAATCRLQVTYRCPRPIAELARRILGPLAPEEPVQAGREGAPVGRFDFPSEAHAHLFLADAVRDLAEREPQASVGVVARTPEAAQAFHRVLSDLPEARLVLEGDFSFQPGIDVTDVGNVKGLEFDYVIVPDASAAAYPLDDDSRRALHVAVTRASHQLWVVAVGSPSPLLAGMKP
ncbi:MAG TPA: ATP-binding domain-containing protein [Myxococcales bacterium]